MVAFCVTSVHSTCAECHGDEAHGVPSVPDVDKMPKED